MASTKTLYVAFANTDRTEGRGYQYAYAVCTHAATAIRLGKGKDVQGSDCAVLEVEILEINGKWYTPKSLVWIHEPSAEDLAEETAEKERNRQKELKAKAIQKAIDAGLNEQEINALSWSE